MRFWILGSSMKLLIFAIYLCLVNPIHADATGISCPLYSTPQDCKRTCYNNCNNLNSITEACHEICQPGCDCVDGYVFESENSNVCVPISQCKVLCPENMTFNPCLRIPQLSCKTLYMHPVRSRYCMPRCVCRTGYVLTDHPGDGLPCIKISECPKIPKPPNPGNP
ncbi:mucin-like protein [Bombina bombina]|uniref:mucin-like protein n=1 Tax=Bombina bombina TaxID=8345 RepID=UPI00235A6E78|nr:mucin-like protein [Bombina bombina]